MDKRKKIVIIIFVIILLVTAIVFVSTRNSSNDNNDKDKEISTLENYYTETDNSISFDSEEPKTETKEKIITINPFQKTEIIIDKNNISGELDIEVMEQYSSKKVNEQIDIVTNNEIIKIEEGLGDYIIKINSKELTGTYNIKWNIQSNDNTELYTSTKGYELKYDSNKFQIINENGKEKFKYIQDENDIYFMVEVIEVTNSEEKETIKNKLIETSDITGNCKITESNLSGIYTETQTSNMKKQNLIFEVADNKMVIIETNQYDEMFEDIIINAHIKNMIKTFRIEDVY